MFASWILLFFILIWTLVLREPAIKAVFTVSLELVSIHKAACFNY